MRDGETIPIIGGARLVGRVGEWDVGIMNLQTARASELPSENFGIYRLRRQVFNANSYAGGILTTRLGEDGSSNVAYGLDGIIRVGENEFLEVKWAQTFDASLTRSDRFNPDVAGYGRLRFERRGQIGLSYIASVTWEGPEFKPGYRLLFHAVTFYQPFARIAYGWFAKEGSAIRSIRPRLFFGHLFP